MTQPIEDQVRNIVTAALAEDIGDGDHTSLSTINPGTTGKTRLIIKEAGILCGVDVAVEVFHQVNPELKISRFLNDGDIIHPGDIAFTVEGEVVSILSGERLALNFMQRMSGIATHTFRLTELIKDLKTRLLDTRKTTPNLRILEKYAVLTGGGINHRFGLFDMILIKDNHVDFAGGIVQAIQAAHNYLEKTGKTLHIEIEVRNYRELDQALEYGGIQRIMLDNFLPENLRKAVEMVDGRFETEASGGITEKNLRTYAETGVDFISIGALTHQIRSLDMSLKAV